METATMGRVLVQATVENPRDLWAVENGLMQENEVRRVEIPDALVDTGATALALPTRLIQQLGLKKHRSRVGTTSRGSAEVSVYSAVRLIVQGRDCTVDVVEVPDEVPALIGQVPLELLDFVVDLKNRKLIGNPEHGGQQMLEMY